MNEPTAMTAAISPVARKNGRPYVVTGPGSGSPVAVSTSVIDSAARPPATAPASTATPTSTGQTGLLRTLDATVVMRSGYGFAVRYSAGDMRVALGTLG